MLIVLDKSSKVKLYLQIYNYIKDNIINGTIIAGSKLPSIRRLVDDLGVSKTTIENAYNQLLMEGYIEGVERSGFFVVKIDDKDLILSKKQNKFFSIEDPKYLNSGITDTSFNFRIWQKELNRVISDNNKDLLSTSSVNGEEKLREEIINYTRQYRGVYAHKNQVIVGAGIQQLLGILLNIIGTENKVAYEYPGYDRVKYILDSYNIKTIPIENGTNGLNINNLKTTNAKVVYVSPSHQYPTGNIMSINNRLELIKWAQDNYNYIIEDDYNSILRYSGNPIPSLQGLSNGENVIYIGSFSTVLFPSLKISYMILPPLLLEKFEQVKFKYSQTASKIEQLALASFMKNGDFERHIRKIKKQYSRKNEIIIEEIKNLNIPNLRVIDSKAGTNLLFEFESESMVNMVQKNAKTLNYKLEKVVCEENKLIFKYTGLNNDEIPLIIRKLILNR
ncbi:PLP-dependent aminotransferase family protein [Mycoplasmatota bacterium]|nr:PLP-dependent aminotransferase family protein [Mycoplasmatota bacterium]